MGFGDYIMLSGRVRILKEMNPDCDIYAPELEKHAFFSKVFFGNPYVQDYSKFRQHRPYLFLKQFGVGIRNEKHQRIEWNVGTCPVPGDLFFTFSENEKAFGEIAVAREEFHRRTGRQPAAVVFLSPFATRGRMINGNAVSYPHYVNKEWPIKKVIALVDALSDRVAFIGTRSEWEPPWNIVGVTEVVCDFRLAAAILKHTDLYFGIEGGLHHAAAAVGCRGIVIFGHWIKPSITGYALHDNLSPADAGHHGCGSLLPCDDCLDYMDKLSVDHVLKRIRAILGL